MLLHIDLKSECIELTIDELIYIEDYLQYV